MMVRGLLSKSPLRCKISLAYWGYFSARARCNPEFWEFILHLLRASTSGGVILKKHNILQLIAKTFSDAALSLPTARAMDFSGDTIMMAGEIDSIQNVVSSPTSSSTERQQSKMEMTAPDLLKLLNNISMALLYIQQTWAAGSREGNVVTVLRGSPEIGAQILGSYLEASQLLVQCGLELDENLACAIVNIWRGCVWGNPNSKKVPGKTSQLRGCSTNIYFSDC